MENARAADHRLEILLGQLLRAGVSLAAVLVIAGAVVYLLGHGGDAPDYSQFRPLDTNRPGPAAIVHGIVTGRGRSLIQAGLLVLIATPIARVLLSLLAFARQRDWAYVGITALVAAVLLFSLLAA